MIFLASDCPRQVNVTGVFVSHHNRCYTAEARRASVHFPQKLLLTSCEERLAETTAYYID